MMLEKVAVAMALLLGLVVSLSFTASAADNVNGVTITPTSDVTASRNSFVKPLTLRGTLGDAQIEMHLQLKPDPTEGIQGSYIMRGQSSKILLAGESENTDVSMEESVNGKDVSGEWEGKLVGDTFSGTWSTADGSVTKPFFLTVQN